MANDDKSSVVALNDEAFGVGLLAIDLVRRWRADAHTFPYAQAHEITYSFRLLYT